MRALIVVLVLTLPLAGCVTEQEGAADGDGQSSDAEPARRSGEVDELEDDRPWDTIQAGQLSVIGVPQESGRIPLELPVENVTQVQLVVNTFVGPHAGIIDVRLTGPEGSRSAMNGLSGWVPAPGVAISLAACRGCEAVLPYAEGAWSVDYDVQGMLEAGYAVRVR